MEHLLNKDVPIGNTAVGVLVEIGVATYFSNCFRYSQVSRNKSLLITPAQVLSRRDLFVGDYIVVPKFDSKPFLLLMIRKKHERLILDLIIREIR